MAFIGSLTIVPSEARAVTFEATAATRLRYSFVELGKDLEHRDQLMSKRVTLSPNEAADCLAIRELVEAYAHCADRRDAKGQMALF
jgi:hypothetical protein